MADPDVQIRREGGHSDPEISGEGGGGADLQKIFSALRASFWSKNKGGRGPLGPFPVSATALLQGNLSPGGEVGFIPC